MTWLQDILFKLIGILAESGPYVMLGFLIAGLLHVLLPVSLFSRIFGRVGVWPLLRAIGLGSLIPICSCGVVPIGIGAYQGGAGVGTVLAFMTAAPTLSPAAVLLSIKLLGVELTLWQIIFVVVGSFVLGMFGNRLFRGYLEKHNPMPMLVQLETVPAMRSCCASREHEHSEPATSPACCGSAMPEQSAAAGDHHHSAAAGSLHQRLGRMIHWVFWDFGPSVSLDMLVGLIFAATVLTLVPTDWIVLLTGSRTVWSLLLVILVALPVYTCSMAAIPVVFSFMMAGMSPGAAVAFIIAGPATNFGEMNALRAQIGWKTATYYFVALLVIAVGAGFLLDHLILPALPETITSPGMHVHASHGVQSWLAWASVACLVGMMLIETQRRVLRIPWFRWKSCSENIPEMSHARERL
ncbi:MAG: permease [Planctomycetaceae bacterium]|nr:permease [Planctomycetaceae bacterium]